MKRFFPFFLAFLLIFSWTGVTADASASPAQKKMPPISAKAAVVMEMESGRILYAKDAYTPLYPASMTKLLTALLLVEHTQPDDRLPVSQHAARQPKSKLGLRPGETITAKEALQALLIRSANDVATVIAEHIAGSEPAFSALMNKRCMELGLRQVYFVTPNGLPDLDHKISAQNMACIMRYAFHYPEIREVLATRSFVYKNRTLYNTNRLLGYQTPEGVILGGKTGFTFSAGYCLVEVMETPKHTHRISVVMGAPNKTRMYRDTLTLLSYPFQDISS
jgi:D-alanyl-D-alanine carboxypeptidase